MKIQIISLFPEILHGALSTSMMKKAQDMGAVTFEIIQLRDFGIGPRKQVDDIIYGGGDGMLLKPEPIFAAIEYAKERDSSAQTFLMTPRGKRYSQKDAEYFAQQQRGMIIMCPRYEGYDERVTPLFDHKLSIGNYVLTGGEIPALTIADSVVRLLPGVLGGETSAQKESFTDGNNLEHPHYTRPEVYRDMSVPDVLLSGNHVKIEQWRRDNSS